MADAYHVGDLTKVISSQRKSKNKKEERKILKQKKKLAALFDRKVPSSDAPVSLPTADKVYKEKPSLEESKKIKKRKKQSSEDVPSKKVKIDTNDDSDSDAADIQKVKKKRPRDTTSDYRTVFVGNLPIDMERKILKRLFQQFGAVENVRLRCPPPAKQGVPKKVIAIKKEFHAKRNNVVGYVCFVNDDSAKKALKMNGHKINEHIIRVDMAGNNKKHNHKCSVFLGNLPANIQEDDVYSHFSECSEIENIRLVRDRMTGMGKGFGYVQFKKTDGVDLALKLNSSELKGRQLRVMRCQSSTKNSGAVYRIENKNKTGKKRGTNTKSFELSRKQGGFKKPRKKQKR